MISNPYFPNNLQSMPVWILWRLEERDGRLTKVPYSALYDGRASSTNPTTWSTFSRTWEKYEAHTDFYDGVGVVISPESGIIFLDADHCFSEEGELDARGEDILEAFGSSTYIEKSQSGTGLHVLAFGAIPRSFKNSTNGVEMYSKARFCAMTGDALVPAEISNCQDALSYCFERYKTPDKKISQHDVPQIPLSHDDQWVVRKASEHGGVFSRLFSGDWKGYGSQSEADSALCVLLAFWTDADSVAIDRIFRSSGLYRAKWEREDYRVSTIQNACAHVGETLSEFVKRKQKEEQESFERVFLSTW